jgi:hypothetical protein
LVLHKATFRVSITIDLHVKHPQPHRREVIVPRQAALNVGFCIFAGVSDWQEKKF